MVSNDDGPTSPGLKALIKALKEFVDVVFVVPEGPKSATSMSVTLHKPLRIRELLINGVKGYVISGSPADAVLVGVLYLLEERPDVVVSGINLGDNTGLQDIYASGTVAAAIQAALMGFKAVAFSMEVGEEHIFEPLEARGDFSTPASYAARITLWVMENGLPDDVHLLNVNFPKRLKSPVRVRITRPSLRKYKNYVVRRKDPRGRPYYWIWGDRLEEYERGTDAYAIFQEKSISITPLNLTLTPSGVSERALDVLRESLESSHEPPPGGRQG